MRVAGEHTLERSETRVRDLVELDAQSQALESRVSKVAHDEQRNLQPAGSDSPVRITKTYKDLSSQTLQ